MLCVSKQKIQNTVQGLKVHARTYMNTHTHVRMHTNYTHHITLDARMEMCELLHGNLLSFK